MIEVNKVYHKDWMQNELPDKSVQLIIADPPYFETKGDFDFIWKSFDDYLIDVEKWAVECKRLLAENGTLFWFGGSKRIAYTQVIFDKYFGLVNNLVWEKAEADGLFGSTGSEQLRSFPNSTERVLMYGLETPQTFISIRQYLWDEYKKTGLSMEQVNKLIGTTSKGGGGMAYNTLSITRTNWDMPKEYIYTALQKTGYFKKAYNELKKEYEELRRPFENFMKSTEILKVRFKPSEYDHDTVKPEKLARLLIKTCSRKNDLVLIPFAGSGTEVAMSVKEGRRAIGFEITERHVEMSNRRVQDILKKPELFG